MFEGNLKRLSPTLAVAFESATHAAIQIPEFSSKGCQVFWQNFTTCISLKYLDKFKGYTPYPINEILEIWQFVAYFDERFPE